jgi:hypothetical protein
MQPYRINFAEQSLKNNARHYEFYRNQQTSQQLTRDHIRQSEAGTQRARDADKFFQTQRELIATIGTWHKMSPTTYSDRVRGRRICYSLIITLGLAGLALVLGGILSPDCIRAEDALSNSNSCCKTPCYVIGSTFTIMAVAIAIFTRKCFQIPENTPLIINSTNKA